MEIGLLFYFYPLCNCANISFFLVLRVEWILRYSKYLAVNFCLSFWIFDDSNLLQRCYVHAQITIPLSLRECGEENSHFSCCLLMHLSTMSSRSDEDQEIVDKIKNYRDLTVNTSTSKLVVPIQNTASVSTASTKNVNRSNHSISIVPTSGSQDFDVTQTTCAELKQAVQRNKWVFHRVEFVDNWIAIY